MVHADTDVNEAATKLVNRAFASGSTDNIRLCQLNNSTKPLNALTPHTRTEGGNSSKSGRGRFTMTETEQETMTETKNKEREERREGRKRKLVRLI